MGQAERKFFIPTGAPQIGDFLSHRLVVALPPILLLVLCVVPATPAHPGLGGEFSGTRLQGEHYDLPQGPCDPDLDQEHVEPRSAGGSYAFLPNVGCGILYQGLGYAGDVHFVRGRANLHGVAGSLTAKVSIVVEGKVVASGVFTKPSTTSDWIEFDFEPNSRVAVRPGARDTSVYYSLSRELGQVNLYLDWVEVGPAPPPPQPECSDGVDNDGDLLVDYPEDPNCASPTDDAERFLFACNDGVDNDGDLDVDHPLDRDCAGPEDDTEDHARTTGIPYDGCETGDNSGQRAWHEYANGMGQVISDGRNTRFTGGFLALPNASVPAPATGLRASPGIVERLIDGSHDCDGDGTPGDSDDHFEWAIGGAWLLACDFGCAGGTGGSVECWGVYSDHQAYPTIRVFDVGLSVLGVDVPFGVYADNVNNAPPLVGPDCGDFESDYGGPCANPCNVGAMENVFPPGLDGSYQVYVSGTHGRIHASTN